MITFHHYNDPLSQYTLSTAYVQLKKLNHHYKRTLQPSYQPLDQGLRCEVELKIPLSLGIRVHPLYFIFSGIKRFNIMNPSLSLVKHCLLTKDVV